MHVDSVALRLACTVLIPMRLTLDCFLLNVVGGCFTDTHQLPGQVRCCATAPVAIYVTTSDQLRTV